MQFDQRTWVKLVVFLYHDHYDPCNLLCDRKSGLDVFTVELPRFALILCCYELTMHATRQFSVSILFKPPHSEF